MKKSIIILASGDIRDKLHYIHYNCGSPALIPINTKPLASYVIDFYLQENEHDVFLFVQVDYIDIVKREMGNYCDKINIVAIEETAGIIDSLSVALSDQRIGSEVVVNVVTTIPVKIPNLNEVFVGIEYEQSIDCSYIDIVEETPVYYSKNNVSKSGFPFVGVFCAKANVLVDICAKITNKTDLIHVVEALSIVEKIKVTNVNWIDCGHETSYFEAKKSLISSRSFNKIEIDNRGVVVKKSSNIKKIKEEIDYINMLPNDLSIYFPRIFPEQVFENGFAGYAMEYYGYPNVSELMLYWNISEASWTKLFKQLDHILIDFSTHRYSIGRDAFVGFYYTKLIDRIDAYSKQSIENLELINKNCMINGADCLMFSELKSKLKEYIIDLYDEQRFSIMHGDFCFNNILYDNVSGIVKLIDARGSFGEKCVGIYGDPLYDYAKLAHSAYGMYDYLVNHLFTLQEKGSEYLLRFNERSNSEMIETLCKKMITKKGISLKTIDVIMATLFLSMTPLHADDENRQKAMYLHGLYLLNKGLK